MLRPVKRSRSTRYDGARQSSFMPWVWCGSSHNTLVIHWKIDAGREALSDGCVRTTTSSEVPATRVLRENLYGGGWKPSPPFVLFCILYLKFLKLYRVKNPLWPLLWPWTGSNIMRSTYCMKITSTHVCTVISWFSLRNFAKQSIKTFIILKNEFLNVYLD